MSDGPNETYYLIKQYVDAHDDRPVYATVANSIQQALVEAGACLASLNNEGVEYAAGHAGDDELFELYPILGHGTVIVEVIE